MEKHITRKRQKVFVPSSGYLYFYLFGMKWKVHSEIVFVPSSGYLYFYYRRSVKRVVGRTFSSPLRGTSISTYYVKFKRILHTCFRPLYGVSLFLLKSFLYSGWVKQFSSLLRGISISTRF